MPFHEWNSVGRHVVTTCHLRTPFTFLCICEGTYIYVPIYVRTIKIHDILSKVISLTVRKVSLILAQFYFLLDGPGMSFVEGIVCPQASQMCCDTPPSFGKDIRRLNFLFCALGGGGVTQGLDATDGFFGTLEPRSTSDERSQYTRRGSSLVWKILYGSGIRCLPASECADIHWGRWYRWQFRGLRWLWAMVVIMGALCLVYHSHSRQDVERIRRQIQIV